MARECSTDLNALSTPESFVTHSNFDTPGGTVYYIPKVSADVLLVKGTVYDSVEECVVAYMKYAAEAGFVVRRSCQKRMLNGDVKQKYLVCNRMGCPKGIHVDTLDLGNSDKQKRNSNLHITGCKARVVFNLDTVTRKFVLHVFDTIHNHELERATRAHHLLTDIKGSYLLVHDTTVDFKNFFRSVNCYIGDSDAQMLIHKMENRKKQVSDFSFDYLVENAELTAIFQADEVSKYNYREFGDVVSFDATFKTNKYKMVFVPFTATDNHRKCVTDTLPIAKHFRVFNSRTRIVEENLHVQFSENKPNIARSGPNWLFDIDALTKSMNYKPVVAGNQSNGSAGTKACDNTSKARKETILGKDYILLPMWPADPLFSQSSKDSSDPRFKPSGEVEKKDAKDLGNEDSEVPCTEESRVNQEKDASVNSTNNINIVNAGGIKDNDVVDENIVYGCDDDPNMPELEEIFYSVDDEDVGAEADINNLDTHIPVSPIPTTR
ncbi:FAR1-related sequence 5-like protein, partial [Tanacetum coccineum]